MPVNECLGRFGRLESEPWWMTAEDDPHPQRRVNRLVRLQVVALAQRVAEHVNMLSLALVDVRHGKQTSVSRKAAMRYVREYQSVYPDHTNSPSQPQQKGAVRLIFKTRCGVAGRKRALHWLSAGSSPITLSLT